MGLYGLSCAMWYSDACEYMNDKGSSGTRLSVGQRNSLALSQNIHDYTLVHQPWHLEIQRHLCDIPWGFSVHLFDIIINHRGILLSLSHPPKTLNRPLDFLIDNHIKQHSCFDFHPRYLIDLTCLCFSLFMAYGSFCFACNGLHEQSLRNAFP